MSKLSKRNTNGDLWKPRNAEDAKWLELMSRRDIVGIRYLQAAKLKRKRKLEKPERMFLKEFESDRRRVLRDPEAAWQKGFDSIHRGLMLIESIIHEKRAQNISEGKDAALYNTVTILSYIASGLRDDIIRYAEDGMPWACHAIFRDGKALASAFARLAVAYPQHFRRHAERSLTMPSLRARNPAFTCDAEAIIQSIHLAEKHHASNIHDNRSRIGALCHQFMAEVVDLVEAARLEAVEKGHMDSRWLSFPALKGNANAWWKLEIKEWVHREFGKMKKNPCRNPALWHELERISDRGTDSARLVAFDKYCFNKLEQIAGKPSLPVTGR
jgi:hypothetical protein